LLHVETLGTDLIKSVQTLCGAVSRMPGAAISSRLVVSGIALRGRFLHRQQPKLPRVKLHDLGEVRKEISQAVVAGIKVILVLHAFLLQFVV